LSLASPASSCIGPRRRASSAPGSPWASCKTRDSSAVAKQGITTPPGDTAYNVSKAGVKVLTEAVAHELRNIDRCRITAHLLIPGFAFTGITGRAEKPTDAWSAEQVVDFMD